jgi:hypothetical protein
MSPGKGEPYPHEKRVLRFAYAAAGAAIALGLWQALAGNGRFLGLEIPVLALAGLVVIGGILSVVAIRRRSTVLAVVGAGIVVLGVVPGGDPQPGALSYALALLFGACVLVMAELVHMTERYERAHRAVEKENVPEEHINRVTDEALKTLGGRAALAAAAVAATIGLAFLLATVGPRQWRAAVETSAPLGVAVLALALAGVASLFILRRGATLRAEPKPKEVLPDVAE